MTLVAAGIGAGVSVAIAGTGMYLDNKAKKKAKAEMDALVQPDYVIPQEIKDNLSDAENRTLEGLPVQQKQEFVKNLDRSATANLKASSDRRGGLAGLQAQTSFANDAYTNLVSMDAAAIQQDKRLKKQEIATARSQMANAKNMAYGIKESNYQNKLTAAQGDYSAAQQGINNAAMSMASTAAGFGVAAMKRPTSTDTVTPTTPNQTATNTTTNTGGSFGLKPGGFGTTPSAFSNPGSNWNLGQPLTPFNPTLGTSSFNSQTIDPGIVTPLSINPTQTQASLPQASNQWIF